jgi:hypothetical protein
MRAMWAEGAATNGVLVRTRASATWVTTTTPDGCCRRCIGRWSSVWTWRGSGLEAGWSRGLGGRRHAAWGSQAGSGRGAAVFCCGHGQARRPSPMARKIEQCNHSWGGCECRVEMHRRLQSLPWVRSGHAPASAFPSERPGPGSSILCDFLAASKSRRNRRAHHDRFAPWFAATMSVLSPLAWGPAWLPLPPHTPLSLPSHPAPHRLMEPAHAVYS